MKIDFLYLTNLQYEVKALKRRLAAFESGEQYCSMKNNLMLQLREVEQKLKATKEELSDSRRAAVRMRNEWIQVNEDLMKECEKRVQVWIRRLVAMEKRAIKAENKSDD